MSMADAPAATRIWDRKDMVPVALFLVLFLLMFREFFFTDKTFFDRDFTLREIPSRKLCTQLLKEGGFALWTEAYGGGQPFLANLKNAVLYPATWVYLVLPFFAAFRLYYLAHGALCWTGLYFLGRSYSLSRRAAFLAASLFVFGGMYLSSIEFYNHVAALAWMPWILILLGRPAGRWVPRTAGLALLWALSILAGAPEITVITLLLGALQVLFLFRDRWRRLALAAGSFGLALLLSAAQLIPSLELWKDGPRAAAHSADWPLEMVQLLSVPFAGILGNDREPGHDVFWTADFFSRSYPLYYSLYIGIAALALAAWGLGKLRTRKSVFLAAAASLFFIMAGGWHSPFNRIIEVIPLVSSIRYPVKFFLGTMLAVCFLAGLGFDSLFSRGQPRKKIEVTGVGILAGFGLILMAFSRPLAEVLGRSFSITSAGVLAEMRTSLLWGAGLTVLAAFIVLIASLSTGARKPLSILLGAIILLDLIYHNRYINPVLPTSFYDSGQSVHELGTGVRVFREDDVPAQLNRGKASILRLDQYARESFFPLTHIDEGVRYHFDEDYLDVYFREYRDLSKAAARCSREQRLKILKTEGCQYYASHTRMPGLPATERSTSEGPFYIHRLADPPIKARLVHSYVAAASPAEKLQACLEGSFDPDRCVIVDRPLILVPSAPPEAEEPLEISESRQGAIRASITLRSDGVIVFPGNFARGWRARVDGRPAEVFRANLSSKGILVPPGCHVVELNYLPAAFRTGVLISLFSLFGLAGSLLAVILSGHRKAKPDCRNGPVFL